MKIAVRRSLALALAAAVSAAGPLQARSLNPGESATVNPGDPVDHWSASGTGAVLAFMPGSTGLSADVADVAVLDMTGATVTASETFTIAYVASASANITTSTFSNDRAAALAVTNGNTSGSPAGVAVVTDSTLSGGGVGAYPQDGILYVSNTRIESTGTGTGLLPSDLATGLAVFANSTIRATNGSTIIGDQNGVVVMDDGVAAGGTIADNTIALDGSHVTGRTGSGIVARGINLIDSTTVTVANGSTVTVSVAREDGDAAPSRPLHTFFFGPLEWQHAGAIS
ncbi:hypothetical protein C1924_10735 [Stenotrophomonas sp. ESTM1D_MKCIP4_1]|uniref:hypothetical protein n=1 Tax=Stenotrophomonas sp. ESTM1D_MKCIP4_1 TaxID=2072414 RepID=UPI000D5402B9|nr:hypothetical protein [Stenotrophomonas sp. ESTM1D_MKCIP4_1]AWH53619.1 hypothetical protein C1924_10735 [Stenotrophomonas sp. ESTM1D_MKCIP4_1]